MPENITKISGATEVDLYLGNYEYSDIVSNMDILRYKLDTSGTDRIFYKNAADELFKIMADASDGTNHPEDRILFTDVNGAAESSADLLWDGSELNLTGDLTLSGDLTISSLGAGVVRSSGAGLISSSALLGIEDLSDPGADKIMFWDETDNACKWLTVSTGLTITGTTLTASGAGATTFLALTDTLSSFTVNRILYESGSAVVDNVRFTYDGDKLEIGDATDPLSNFGLTAHSDTTDLGVYSTSAFYSGVVNGWNDAGVITSSGKLLFNSPTSFTWWIGESATSDLIMTLSNAGDLTLTGDLLVSEYIKRSAGTDDLIRFENDKISIQAGGAVAMVFEDDRVYSGLGKFGFGKTSIGAWEATDAVLQIGGTGALFSEISQDTGKLFGMAQNIYSDGDWKKFVTDYATLYIQGSGNHEWYADDNSVAADTGYTPTLQMILNYSGNLGLGESIPTGKLHIAGGFLNSESPAYTLGISQTGTFLTPTGTLGAVHQQQVTFSSASSTATAYGFMTNSTTAGAGTPDYIRDFASIFTVNSAGGLGTHTAFYSGFANPTGTVSLRYGFYIDESTGAGGLTSQYGIYIAALTKGSTNYSIYTGSAKCRLGGDVDILGVVNCSGLNSSSTPGVALHINTSTNEVFEYTPA